MSGGVAGPLAFGQHNLRAAVVAVLAGLGAGCSSGVGVALQYRQAQLAPAAERTPMRLLAHLARQPRWLAGKALAAAGYGLQALALAFGPLALVAPVAGTDMLFALPLVAPWSGRPMRARDYAGCVLASAGVAAFLAASPPSAGRSDAATGDWALAFTAVMLLAAAAVTAGRRARGPARASLLALAGGAVHALAAALTLNVTRLMSSGSLGQLVGHWQCWALAGLGAGGVLLSVSTHWAGPLRASLPVIDMVEPISAVLLGTLVFGERLAASPAGLALQLAGAAAAVAGIMMLGRSSLGARAMRASLSSIRPPQVRADDQAAPAHGTRGVRRRPGRVRLGAGPSGRKSLDT